VNLFDSDLWAGVWNWDDMSGMRRRIGLVLFAKDLVSLIVNFPCFGFLADKERDIFCRLSRISGREYPDGPFVDARCGVGMGGTDGDAPHDLRVRVAESSSFLR